MDLRKTAADTTSSDAAVDFVRFCYRRRPVGWPELYDEMCAVASRGLYHGWGFGELGERGIGFGLSELPRLAALAFQIGREEGERRHRLLAGVMARIPARADDSQEEIGHPAFATAGR